MQEAVPRETVSPWRYIYTLERTGNRMALLIWSFKNVVELNIGSNNDYRRFYKDSGSTVLEYKL